MQRRAIRTIKVTVLTTVGLIRVVATVVHAITFPVQAHAHSVGTLEVVGITLLLKLRMAGWWWTVTRSTIRFIPLILKHCFLFIKRLTVKKKNHTFIYLFIQDEFNMSEF